MGGGEGGAGGGTLTAMERLGSCLSEHPLITGIEATIKVSFKSERSARSGPDSKECPHCVRYQIIGTTPDRVIAWSTVISGSASATYSFTEARASASTFRYGPPEYLPT